jgi:hypothetical protein
MTLRTHAVGMQTNVAMRSRLVGWLLGFIFVSVGFLIAQQNLTPNKPPDGALGDPNDLQFAPAGRSNSRSGLAPPAIPLAPVRPPPQTIKNSDGSTTTAWFYPNGTVYSETVNSKGELISKATSRSDSTYGQGSQTTEIQKFSPDGNTIYINEERDSHGVIRHLVRSDTGLTRDEFRYGEDGKLVKATVSRQAPDETGHTSSDYRPSPDGSGGERYNLMTGKWEPVSHEQWPAIADRLRANEKDIQGARDKLKAPKAPEKAPEPEDELASVREEAAKHPMEVAGSPGPLAAPSDPFETRERDQLEAEKQLDPCLVGTWRSESIEVTLLNEKGGGEGIVITIGKDRSVTIDYSAMTPMRGGHANNVWKGSAFGHMWAFKGRGGTTSIERAEAYLITNGRRNPQGNYKDLGPAKITRYECNETTLVTESVTHKITYARQKE